MAVVDAHRFTAGLLAAHPAVIPPSHLLLIEP